MALLLNHQQSQLLIVDEQVRLASAMPAEDWQKVESNSQRLLQAANRLNIPVIVSEQYPKGLGATLESIKGLLNDSTAAIEKTHFSCCKNENYRQQLIKNNRQQLVICGMETHVCILQTAVDALELGYEVFVVADAVCSRQTEHKNNALSRLQQAGVVISNHESVLFEWLRNSKHPEFKFISTLVK